MLLVAATQFILLQSLFYCLFFFIFTQSHVIHFHIKAWNGFYPSYVLRTGQKKNIGYITTKCIIAVNMYACVSAQELVRVYIKSDQIIKWLLTRFIFIDYDLTYTKKHKKRIVNWLYYLLVLPVSCFNEIKFIINHKAENVETVNVRECVRVWHEFVCA